ncbi:hypothetical protein AB9K32_05035 [Allomuricauda sp. XS_ASV26]
MLYLNKEIELLAKRKKSRSLIKKQISCGIFQDLDTLEQNQVKRKTFQK